MAKEAQIVSKINEGLMGYFTSKAFQKGRYSGIAELVTSLDGEQRQRIPAIVNNNGDVTKIAIDDSYTYEVYHRHISSSVKEEDKGWGDRTMREETAAMKLIVTGDRRRLNVSKEDIITGIMLGIPLELGSVFLTANALYSANIIPGDIELDMEAAWNAEYNTQEVMLKPHMIFLAMNYDIVTTVNVGCMSVCAN